VQEQVANLEGRSLETRPYFYFDIRRKAEAAGVYVFPPGKYLLTMAQLDQFNLVGRDR
jgi:hypothetical protein